MSLSRRSSALVATAITTQISSLFWEQYLPFGIDLKSQQLAATPHLLNYRQLASKDKTLQTTLDAVALLCVSQQKDDDRLALKGTNLYIAAINALQCELNRPERRTSDAILASCRAITLYEMFRPSTKGLAEPGNDWNNHVHGLASIVQARRSTCSDSPVEQAMYNDAKALASHLALRCRKSEVFSKFTEWPQHDTTSPTLQDVLTEHIIPVTTWLGKHDKTMDDDLTFDQDNHLQTRSHSYGRDLLLEGLQALTRLYSFEKHASLACGLDMRETESGSLGDRCARLLNAARHTGYCTWFVIIQYFSIHVVLCSQLRFARRYFELVGHQALPELSAEVDARPFAAGIARSAFDLFARDAGLWTLEQIVLPVMTAICFYAATETESCDDAQQLQMAFLSQKNAVFTRGFLGAARTYVVPESAEQMIEDMRLRTSESRIWYHIPLHQAFTDG